MPNFDLLDGMCSADKWFVADAVVAVWRARHDGTKLRRDSRCATGVGSLAPSGAAAGGLACCSVSSPRDFGQHAQADDQSQRDVEGGIIQDFASEHAAHDPQDDHHPQQLRASRSGSSCRRS